MKLLEVRGLKKYFEDSGLFRGRGRQLKAVDGIDLAVDKDRVVALVGESGCGKSTVARLVLRLMTPTAGGVFFRGKDIFRLDRSDIKAYRKSVQIIFQDPFASLNPRRTVFDTVSEPLKIHRLVSRDNLRNAAVELVGKVGLGPDTINRYPHEFSGGQRQRICIARALAVSPELIVADEPLSALDVSIQAQIINLLQDLKGKERISFLFISHDLRVVQYFSDSIGVMYLGRIVEYGDTPDLFSSPMHPYTVVLLESAPKMELSGTGYRRPAPLKGEVPSPVNVPAGCPFHPRCPKRFEPCDKAVPELKERDGRLVACHLWNSPSG